MKTGKSFAIGAGLGLAPIVGVLIAVSIGSSTRGAMAEANTAPATSDVSTESMAAAGNPAPVTLTPASGQWTVSSRGILADGYELTKWSNSDGNMTVAALPGSTVSTTDGSGSSSVTIIPPHTGLSSDETPPTAAAQTMVENASAVAGPSSSLAQAESSSAVSQDLSQQADAADVGTIGTTTQPIIGTGAGDGLPKAGTILSTACATKNGYNGTIHLDTCDTTRVLKSASQSDYYVGNKIVSSAWSSWGYNQGHGILDYRGVNKYPDSSGMTRYQWEPTDSHTSPAGTATTVSISISYNGFSMGASQTLQASSVLTPVFPSGPQNVAFGTEWSGNTDNYHTTPSAVVSANSAENIHVAPGQYPIPDTTSHVSYEN